MVWRDDDEMRARLRARKKSEAALARWRGALLTDDAISFPARDRQENHADVVRGMCVVGWLIVLYGIVIAVSAFDEHYTRKLNALRQPVPVRTER